MSESIKDLKDLLTKITVFENLSDESENVFMDVHTGQRYNFDYKRLVKLFTRAGANTAFYDRIPAIFIYDPRGKLVSRGQDKLVEFNCYAPPTSLHENFYSKSALPLVQNPPSIYLEFLTHFTAQDQRSVSFILDWIANSLTGRNLTYLTTCGDMGIGKGILGDILKALHGSSNYLLANDSILKTGFNIAAKNKTCIYLDEISIKTSEELDRLKAFVNNEMLYTAKGKDSVNEENYANLYISTNRPEEIKLEAGDRRFSVVELTEEKLVGHAILKGAEIKDYRAQLLDPENIAQFAYYLKGRKIETD